MRLIGRTISHYHIKERLGGGGMGVVYKAQDTRLNRLVALKFLPPELTRDADARERFVHEARAASALDHPNICAVHDIDETPEGESFICMAYCEGETLKRKMQGGRLPLADAIGYAEQVCEGLARAHERGIVHRDIKPANLMVTHDGVVKIVDFGLAKLAGNVSLTRTGTMVGTAAYVSPEQARGTAVDHRADLWSVGVVLFEMVTGRLPFHAEHVQSLLLAVLHDPEPSVMHVRGDTPVELARIIHRCLRKNPGERYQTARELASDLRRVRLALEAGVDTTTGGVIATGGRWRRREQAAWLALAAVAIGAVAVAGAVRLGVVWRLPHRSPLPAEKHVVVLPFLNVGGDPGGQAFCDGLVETLTSKLTQLAQTQQALWVVPASEVRSRKVDSAEAARRHFGANLVVTGSAQRSEDNVRVTLNLVDSASLRQISSAVIDDLRTHLSGLQDGALGELAAMLGATVDAPARTRLAEGASAVPGAYELYLEGRGALQRFEKTENLEAAIASFSAAVAKDPTYAAAFAGLAEAYFRAWKARKDPQWVAKAEAACARALALDGQLAAGHATFGMIRNGTGRYEDAVTELDRAIALEPGNADAYRELARAYGSLSRFADAEATYRKAIALDPKLWVSYNMLGVFYWEQGRFQEALSQFQRVVQLAPDNHWGYNNLGGLYLYLGEIEKARSAFARSIALEPNHAAYSNLATISFQAGSYDEAAKMYAKALESDASDYTLWGNLAAAYRWGSGDRSRAQPLYQRAAAMAAERLEVNPRDPAVLTDLAAYDAELGRASEARALVSRALAAAPADPGVMFQAGVTCERLGDRAGALEWIGRALAHGYPRDEVMRAPDLAGLRQDPAFGAVQRTQPPAR
jgi:eukaryotic-like serine/threonine-protein kinase